MSTGFKKKAFKLTPTVIFRVILFSIIVFVIITYLSDSRPQLPKIHSSSVLGEKTNIKTSIYNRIPANSRQQLENLNKSPVIISLQEKIDLIKKETNNFPQNQIKIIKKSIIQNIYQNLMNNVESGK